MKRIKRTVEFEGPATYQAYFPWWDLKRIMKKLEYQNGWINKEDCDAMAGDLFILRSHMSYVLAIFKIDKVIFPENEKEEGRFELEPMWVTTHPWS